MSEIRAGRIFLFYLFDVAETIDLQAIPALLGGPAVAAKLAPKSAIPAYVQYDKPPLSFGGAVFGIGDVEGFQPRFRAYDYGVISLALVRPFNGDSRLQRPRWYDQWLGSHYTRAARQVHALFIDVNELTDRTENALKFTGDIYAARLFTLVADRLGLETWKADVEAKLRTLDDIYRFAVEQSSMSRGQFLELTIVLILVLELVLVFLGIT